MKKFKSFLALLLLGGLVVTGCGKDKTPSNSGGSQQNSGGSQSGDSGSGGGNQGGEGGGQQGGEGGGQQGGGGEQGGGEVPAESQFANKKFVFDSVSYPDNATIENTLNQNYQGAYASLFQNGKFELVSVVDTYTMALLGNFTVAEDDSYARLDVLKEYDGRTEAYDYVTSGTFVTNIRYNEGSQKYVLPMQQEIEDHVIANFTIYLTRSNEAPEPADLPQDPNGETFDPAYQVYKDVWDRLFVNRGLLHSSASNFIVTHDTTIFEIDNHGSDVSRYYLHYTVGAPNSGTYYERTSIVGNSYNYNCTIVAGGEVSPASPVEYGVDFFDEYVGLAPIPFNWMQYNSVGHYYFRNSYTYQNSFSGSRTVNNYRVYFGANYRVQKITYEDDAHQAFEFNFSNYNTVEIDIPTAGGGGGSGANNPDDYYTTVGNKIYEFDRLAGDSWSDEERTATLEVFDDGIVQAFTDGTIEMCTQKTFGNMGEVVNTPMVQYGTYDLDQYHEDYLRATSTFNAYLMNGEYIEIPAGYESVYYIRYYFSNSEIRVQVDDGQYLYFTLAVGTPTHTDHPAPSGGGGGGGGDPVVSWPTQWVNDALTAWGVLNDTVPTVDLTGITAINSYPLNAVTDGDTYFYISLIGADKESAYVSALSTAGYELFTDEFSNEVYVTDHRELAISLYASSSSLMIYVSRNVPALPMASYPAADIASYLSGTSDSIIDFTNAFALSYTLQKANPSYGMYYDYLSINFTEDALADAGITFVDICTAYENQLFDLGYGYKSELNYYGFILVSPNREIGIGLNYSLSEYAVEIMFINFTMAENEPDFYVDYVFKWTGTGYDLDSPEFYAWIWTGTGEHKWIQLTMLWNDVENYDYLVYQDSLSDAYIGMKIFRWDPDAEYKPTPDEEEFGFDEADPPAGIWNKTNDIDLSDNKTTITFSFTS